MKNGIIFVLVVALIAAGVWGYLQYQEKNEYYTFLDNQFQRMFYDLTGSVETITTDISKLLVSSQSKETVPLYSNILMNAYNAQEKLSQLPIRHGEVAKIEKFLNQVGDYTFALSKKTLNGEKLSEKEVGNLERLHNYSMDLGADLHELQDKALDGKVWKGELRRKANEELKKEENPIQAQFTKFEERMVEYPELIYDGPFSDHAIQGMKPRIQGKRVSEEEAKKVAVDFVGKAVVESVEKRDDNKGKIDTYSFTMKAENEEEDEDNPFYMDVSQKGGRVVWLLNNREVKEGNISPKEGIEKASSFLEEKGFKSMTPMFNLRYDNVVVINYVYVQDEVLMYPDLIKVKVGLDDGTIVGFDATSFLTANYQREIPEPKLSPEEAREKVSREVKVDGEPRLSYIPTPSFQEIYCYEFKGTYKGDDFFIYINAETGEEERILKVIKSENGTLMM